MGEGAHELASAIGARVRSERLARRWTLDRLAERSGVSRRMIVKVEKGETNPSVTTLLSLSNAFGIGLPSLVGEREGTPPALTRRGEGATLWSSPAGGRGVLLAGTPDPDVLALWHWTLVPGDIHRSAAHSPGTREILHVTSGAITLGLALDQFELGIGDTLTFAGDQPHSYANAGTEAAHFTLVVSEPDVGATSQERHHR